MIKSGKTLLNGRMLFAVCVASFIVLAASGTAIQAQTEATKELVGQSQSSAAPEEAARDFYYKWYLHALFQSPNADPFKEQKSIFEKHVTARLLQKLANSRRTSEVRKGPDVDTEYFFGTLDLDSEWQKYITVLRPTMNGATAVVLLHLIGHDADTDQDLKVVLKKESGLWKIDDVALWR